MSGPEAGRKAILEAAQNAFIEGGGEFEVKEIAQAAGVSVGLIYHHFKSKAGLISAIINAFYDRYDEIINLPLEKGLPWGEREFLRLKRTVEYLYRDPIAPIILGRLSGSAEVMAVETVRRRAILALAADNFRNGQEYGQISLDIDVELAAAMVLGGLREAAAMMFAGRLDHDAETFARQAWRIVEKGLALSDKR